MSHTAASLENAPPAAGPLPAWQRGVLALGNISVFTLFLLMFFSSGASALMYEVVWTRSLALVFGVTLQSISAVLASFMAGMAVGSYVAGWLADRVRWPLLYYSAMEIAIGLTALASLKLIAGLTPLYVALYHETGGDQALVTLVRFLAACGVMLVPTALMGATLPFMVRASLLHLSNVGENISLLYALNTAGAAAGTLLAGFVLIGAYGLQATVYIGAAVNVAVGALALVLAVLFRPRRARFGPAEAPPAAALRTAGQPAAPAPPAREGARAGLVARLGRVLRRAQTGRARHAPHRPWVTAAVLVGMAVSGFCALAYEVIWFRILDLFLNGTTYAFTVMLVTFLVGLAGGSALTRLVIGLPFNWAVVLGLLQAAIAWVSFTALGALPELPLLRAELLASPMLGGLLQDQVFGMAAVAALALAPLALLLGMTFPVAAQAIARVPGREGAHIGALNAANTVGAIGGSLAGGLWLIPTVGTQASMVSLAWVNAGLAAVLVWVGLRRWWLRLAVPVAAVAVGLNWQGPREDVFPPLLRNLFPGHEYLWHEEGVENTVSVQRLPAGYLAMYLNSREQAYDEIGTVRFHQLIGQLGMVLHPEPWDVLVIGLGGGATPGAISRFQDAAIDVVELSPTVVRAADRYFSPVNNDILRQPNVQIRIDDGRNHLLLTDRRYDLITADIIQAHHAGSGNLYSREYFELARGALKPGGLMVQWVNPGHPETYPLIVRTFASVFPGATSWFSGQLVVGSNVPQERAALERTVASRLADPAVKAALVPELNLDAPGLPYYDGPIEELMAGWPPGLVLTDDRPLTEYFRSIPRTGATS